MSTLGSACAPLASSSPRRRGSSVCCETSLDPCLRGDDDGRNTGAITVTSGRCVPPLYGAFNTYTSPGRIVPVRRSMIVRTLSPMDPKCTGICGALAIK